MLRAPFPLRLLVLGVMLAAVAACKHDAPSTAGPGGSASAPTASQSRQRFPVPTGPRLAILAGQGVGPIRIGATVATIERLMGVPCEEKSPTACRYLSRGLVFELGADGKATRIRINRMDRDAGSGKVYGYFNGAIPPDVQLDMVITAVQDELGPPDRVEAGNSGAAREAVSQHFYKGMVLEYDRLPNGRVVLGGVRIPD